MWKCREGCGSLGRYGNVYGGMGEYREVCGSVGRDVEV